MTDLQVVVGGQYGSEAKGHVTHRLVKRAHEYGNGNVINTRVAGPNAGHTVYDKSGNKFALRQVPVGAVEPDTMLVISPGSEVDLTVLEHEIDLLESYGHKVANRLYVDQNATLLTSAHQATEQEAGLTARLGSTSKGIGAARMDRLNRSAQTIGQILGTGMVGGGITVLDTTQIYRTLSENDTIVIEGTQGYGLGLHTNNYPYVTSSDCRAIDFLAMAGISPWALSPGEFRVWVVARAFPIRVAGNSGPMLDETSWEALGLPKEYTTVTHKERRVGMWDTDLVRAACVANGSHGWLSYHNPVRLALTMLDQIDDYTANNDNPKWLDDHINMIEQIVGTPVGMVTYGAQDGQFL